MQRDHVSMMGPSFSDSFSGTIFALSTSGSLVQKVVFDCEANKLLQGADGKLYGASGECSGNQGNIFSIDGGLPAPNPAVSAFAPRSGKAGSQVTIRGNHLVGTTTVTFNGVSATFKVLNSNYITVTVTPNATSGPIAVTNAGGTTESGTAFLVE